MQLLVADTAFFHFFNYPIEGVQMQLPNDALVTRKFAERVFGKENPIGRKVKYAGGHILTICGILNEPNYKSSLTFDIVFNISLKTDSRGWGKIHTDLLHFMPGVDVNAINAFSNVYRQTNKGYHIRFDFIPVSELYWNKELGAKGDSPEMWQYGSRSHLWILSGVCVLLMFAGILNFINIYLIGCWLRFGGRYIDLFKAKVHLPVILFLLCCAVRYKVQPIEAFNWYDYSSPLNLLMAASMFCIFLKIKVSQKLSGFILFFSTSAVAVYLITDYEAYYPWIASCLSQCLSWNYSPVIQLIIVLGFVSLMFVLCCLADKVRIKLTSCLENKICSNVEKLLLKIGRN